MDIPFGSAVPDQWQDSVSLCEDSSSLSSLWNSRNGVILAPYSGTRTLPQGSALACLCTCFLKPELLRLVPSSCSVSSNCLCCFYLPCVGPCGDFFCFSLLKIPLLYRDFYICLRSCSALEYHHLPKAKINQES